jgi:hypothetical protein
MAALLIGVERVTHAVARCKIYEALYRIALRDTDELTNLERSLVGLYVVILEYLSAASDLFDMSTLRRIGHAMLMPDKVEAFLAACENALTPLDIDASNCERLFQRAVHDEVSAKLQQLLTELQAPLVRIDRRVAALSERSRRAEHGAILRWVSDIPYETNHHLACHGRTQGTAEWILTRPTYLEWRSTSASMFLWLHGIRK